MPYSLSLSTRLRAATKARHARAEHQIGLQRWLSDRASYARFLQLHESMWRSAQECLGSYGGPFDACDDAIEAVRSDLEQLEEVEPEDGDAPAPCFDSLPTQPDARLRGIAYVLMGSRLGSSTIARHALEALGSDLPVRLLLDPSIRMHWQNTQQWIDRVGPNRSVVVHATRAALETFDTVARHFTNDRLGLTTRAAIPAS